MLQIAANKIIIESVTMEVE